MAEYQKRQIAYKTSIVALQNGTYYKEEGMQPNYIQTLSGRKISRANIVGCVVKTPTQEDNSLVLDDGAQITLTSFEEGYTFPEYTVGQILQVVGKPRSFQDQLTLVVETIQPVEESWFNVRKAELKLIEGSQPEPTVVQSSAPSPAENEIVQERVAEVSEEELIEEVKEESPSTPESIPSAESAPPTEETLSPKAQLLNFLKEHDQGQGVDVEHVVSEIKEGEALIDQLLREGEIFEISAGKIKVLE